MLQVKPNDVALEEYKNNVSIYRDLKKEKTLLFGGWNAFFLYGFFYVLIFFLWLFLTNGQGIGDDLFGSIWLAALAYGFLRNFVINFLNSGKLNQLEQEIKEVEKLLRSFEVATCDYYRAKLEEFFISNLYKKRSGNSIFEESLSEFQSMIEKLSVINSKFITTRIPLEAYKKYLLKRIVNHNFQSSKKSEELISIANFAKSVSERRELKKEIPAPEKFYRTAGKIYNWDDIIGKRKMTGLKGEEIVVVIEQEYLESINRKDLADKVRHVAVEDGDGLGYDILSFFADGREKYIEVKSTTVSLRSAYYISENELGFLREHTEDAFIYRVLISGDTPEFKSYSNSDFLAMSKISPIQYIVHVK